MPTENDDAALDLKTVDALDHALMNRAVHLPLGTNTELRNNQRRRAQLRETERDIRGALSLEGQPEADTDRAAGRGVEAFGPVVVDSDRTRS